MGWVLIGSHLYLKVLHKNNIVGRCGIILFPCSVCIPGANSKSGKSNKGLRPSNPADVKHIKTPANGSIRNGRPATAGSQPQGKASRRYHTVGADSTLYEVRNRIKNLINMIN